MLLSDPFVNEIHATREAIAKTSNDDLGKIAEAARSRQVASGRKVVNCHPGELRRGFAGVVQRGARGNIRRVAHCLCFAMLTAGCAKATVPLSKMRSLDVESAPGGALRVTMVVDERTADQALACKPPAPKAVVTFNGAPLERITGILRGDDLAINADCLLWFTMPGQKVHKQPGAALLRIAEGPTQLELSIANAFTPRQLSLRAPADGVLRRGMTVTLRWQPETDLIQHDKVALGLRRRGAKVIEADQVAIRHTELSWQGHDVTFKVPESTPPSLGEEIEIQFLGTAYVTPGLGPCPVERCKVHLDLTVPPVPALLR